MHDAGLPAKGSLDTEIATLWDFVVRGSSVCLFMLLVVAYVTGEEVQHTHVLIGYAIAALLLIQLWWELFRPHQSRYLDSIFHLREVLALFQRAGGELTRTNKTTDGLFLMGIAMVVAAISFFALVLIFLTHNFYSATAIDEMHEVVAYFALGLVAFHIVMVVVISTAQFDSRNDMPLSK
jgi:cytochrome b